MKILSKLFYVLAIGAMLATAVGFFWTLWINAIVGVKVVVTAIFSALIFACVSTSLDNW